MTWRDWISGGGVRAALGALAVAVLTLGWTVVGALEPSTVAEEPGREHAPSGVPSPPVARPPVDISAAVATDVFRPSRSAPAVRYRPPDGAPVAQPAAQEPVRPLVLGTAISADGSSFATCRFGSPRLLMLRVGDRVGGYVVRSIDRGRVVFIAPGGKPYEVLASRPGS